LDKEEFDMAEPFLGEIRMMGFTFPPRDWALCDGQSMAVSQFSALYSLLGTQFGGNGTTDFKLPDLRGRTPIHPNGSTIGQGDAGGAESVTLVSDQMPHHNHAMKVSSAAGSTGAPSDNYYAVTDETHMLYTTGNPATKMGAVVSNTGGSHSHSNLQPSSVISFCIALQGYYPSRP